MNPNQINQADSKKVIEAISQYASKVTIKNQKITSLKQVLQETGVDYL